MPKIVISEEDLTISNEVDVAANVVYVPGMTLKEVDEKPVLFTTVEEFTKKYGEEPYKFKHAQVIDGKEIVGEGEYEKSYIYAIELLTAGLPIYFQNIVKIENDDTDALQDFYLKLGLYRGNSKTAGDVSVEVGAFEYKNNQEIFTSTNIPYQLVSTETVGNYAVYGFIPYNNDTATNTYLGLPNGNRFVVKTKNSKITSREDLPENTICTIAVSDGTTNTYTKANFEEDGSLITVLNVRPSSEVTIDITWKAAVNDDPETEENEAQDADRTVLKFTFTDATFGNENESIDTESAYSIILDNWTYNIKFITTGGYPTILDTKKDIGLLETISMAAAVRGDSVALADIPYNENIYEAYKGINDIITEEILETNYYVKGGQSNKCNLVFTLNEKRKGESTLKYSTIVGPYATYEIYNNILTAAEIERVDLPGSFGYLLGLVNNINTLKNPDYLAIAGVTRGLVPHIIQLKEETTGAQADAVQVREKGKMSLNPIIYVQNYGYCIWGNRTLFPNIFTKAKPQGDLAASSFLNIRVMAADVKKVIYDACRKLTFETNNIELWLKFKAEVEPILEKMVANGALERYELTKLATTEKATLSVYVKLVTLYAVEDFDVTVGLTDSTVEEAV